MSNQSISKNLLGLFIKFQAGVDVFLDFTYHPHSYVYKQLLEEYGYKEVSIRSSINRLQKKGMLTKEKNKDGKIIFRLTGKGEADSISQKLKMTSVDKLNDGYILAIFDIPEDSRISRIIRDVLRRRLKEFGFVLWQKSVWATDKNIYELVRQYFDRVNLLNYLIIIETKRSSNNG